MNFFIMSFLFIDNKNNLDIGYDVLFKGIVIQARGLMDPMNKLSIYLNYQ